MRTPFLIACWLLFTSCGVAGSPGVPSQAAAKEGISGSGSTTRTPSPAALSKPPLLLHMGRIGSCIFSTKSVSNALVFSGVRGAKRIRFPGTHVLLAQSHRVGDVDYFLVGVVGSDDSFGLNRMHDADGDWIPDLSTHVSLLKLPPAHYMTDFVVSGGHWYFLDRRTHDVWRSARAGDWPSALAPTPFARAADHPELRAVQSLTRGIGNTVLTCWAHPPLRDSAYGVEPVISFCDHDADGIEDASVLGLNASVHALQWRPYAGQTRIRAAVEKEGTYEVWALGERGGESTRLASYGAGPADSFVELPLDRALVQGERIRVRERANSRDDWPTVRPEVRRSARPNP